MLLFAGNAAPAASQAAACRDICQFIISHSQQCTGAGEDGRGGKEGKFGGKSWSAKELPINLQACVVWERFLYVQHRFGGLTGIEQGGNWPFKEFLDPYF